MIKIFPQPKTMPTWPRSLSLTKATRSHRWVRLCGILVTAAEEWWSWVLDQPRLYKETHLQNKTKIIQLTSQHLSPFTWYLNPCSVFPFMRHRTSWSKCAKKDHGCKLDRVLPRIHKVLSIPQTTQTRDGGTYQYTPEKRQKHPKLKILSDWEKHQWLLKQAWGLAKSYLQNMRSWKQGR